MNHLFAAAICTIVVMILAACGPQYAPSGDSNPAVSAQNLAVRTSTPAPSPYGDCTLTFSSPISGASLPTHGPVDFSWSLVQPIYWSNHWFLEKYVLVIKFPGGNPLAPYEIQNSITYKTLYMENFQPAGTYTAQISAIGWAPYYEAGSVLCWDEITFSKEAFARKIQKGQPTPCLAGVCP